MINTNRFAYAPTLETEDNIKYSGMINTSQWNNLNSTFFKIPLKMQYRPDLISQSFYGTPKYAWLLAYINNITNTPKGFETGLDIIIPNKSELI